MVMLEPCIARLSRRVNPSAGYSINGAKVQTVKRIHNDHLMQAPTTGVGHRTNAEFASIPTPCTTADIVAASN